MRLLYRYIGYACYFIGVFGRLIGDTGVNMCLQWVIEGRSRNRASYDGVFFKNFLHSVGKYLVDSHVLTAMGKPYDVQEFLFELIHRCVIPSTT